MDFCSEFGYNYGFDGSDSESFSEEDEKTKQRVRRKIRKADTNIISVKFDQLDLHEAFAGEPKICKKCTAIVSYLSDNYIEKLNDKILWKCEFCSETNDLTKSLLDTAEIPKKDGVTFILELPKENKEEKENKDGVNNNDDTYLAFCIDNSGSMDGIIPTKKQKGSNDDDDNDIQVKHIHDLHSLVQNTCNQNIAPIAQISSNQDIYYSNNLNVIPNDIQQQCVIDNSISNISISDDKLDTNETNLTRLEGVKVACLENLKKMKDEVPNKRVALVTFSNYVEYYGDCTQINRNKPILTIGNGQPNETRSFLQPGSFKDKVLNFFSRSKSPTKNVSKENESESDYDNYSPPGDLNNKERITALANNMDGNLKGISTAHKFIEERIKNLRTDGSTALGPALLFSICFASKIPGSSIILCTDGCANVGIGSIDYQSSKKNETFYDNLADFAKTKAVTVNVISMEGTDCKLALLGRVADRSNGTLSIVNPLNLSDEFKSILQNRIVATNVTAKLIVNHKYLYIRDEKLDAEEGKAIEADNLVAKEALNKKKQSCIIREIGNANIDTEITFEYGFRKFENSNENPDNIKELPFQLQITYTRHDGAKAIRVFTKTQKFTRNREEAEKKVISQDLIYTHAAQQMSKQVLSSNVGVSKYQDYAYDKLFSRNNYNVPEMYQETSGMIKQFSKSKKAADMGDKEAERFFSQAKVSRAKMSKK